MFISSPSCTWVCIYKLKGLIISKLPNNLINIEIDDNQRAAKEVNGVITEKYLWANLTTLLAVYDGNDNLVQRFNYTDTRMPISMTQDSQTCYLHYDQVGTLRAISDTNHNIIKEVTYDTFGNILSETNQNVNIPFGFAGGLHDRDTNLVHFGYREYDPYTGKWTTKDPIDFSGGDSNLYGYVLEDPVNLVDPEGLNAIGWGLACYTAYESWKAYDELAKKSQSYRPDHNQSDLDYWNNYYNNMNSLMPIFQQDTSNIWQNQIGNNGSGLGGRPPGR